MTICPCIFIKRSGSEFVIIAIYVDDLNLIGTPQEITEAKDCLKKIFVQPSNINLKAIKKGLSFAYYSPVTFLEKQKLNKLEHAW